MYGPGRPFFSGTIANIEKWLRPLADWIESRVGILNATTSQTIRNDIYYVRADSTSGNITITLPYATGLGGRQITVEKISSDTNTVTLGVLGSDTINGSTTKITSTQYDSWTVISNGDTKWEIIAGSHDGSFLMGGAISNYGASDPFTQCHLVPRNGNKILIDGKREIIPSGVLSSSGGVQATYSSCSVDKTVAQSLSANTTYFIYAYMLSGVMTLDFSTTGHTTDATYGIEVKTGDATCTLVGMLHTNAASKTLGNSHSQTIVSYYNRLRYFLFSNIDNKTFSSAASWTVLDSAEKIEWMQWADDLAVGPKALCNFTAASAGETISLGILYNGTTAAQGYYGRAVADVTTASSVHLTAHALNSAGTDGYYTAELAGLTAGGTNVTAVLGAMFVEGMAV